MNRIEFRDFVLSIIKSYPVTPRQIKTFAVVDVDKAYDADNLFKFDRDYQQGDFWQRSWEANGASVNTLAKEYPICTMANVRETVTPEMNNSCQKVTATYLIEIADTQDCADSKDENGNPLYRSMSVFDNDLMTQARWLIAQIHQSTQNGFTFDPIELNLFDFGIDKVKGVQFEIVLNYTESNIILP